MRFQVALQQLQTVAARRWGTAPDLDRLDAWIVSPGGVATTALLRHCERFLRVNDAADRDGLKHWPRPPPALRRHPIPTLFVSGRRDTIIASLERRHWLQNQALKLGSFRAIAPFESVIRAGLGSAIDRQRRAWAGSSLANVRVVDHEELWQRIPEIAAFLAIEDRAFVDEFPERRARRST